MIIPTKLRNTLSVFILCIITLLTTPGPALSQNQTLGYPTIETTPVHNWVLPTAIPEARQSRMKQVQDGVYYLIYDSQSRLESDHYISYRHTVVEVINRTGLEEAARLQFSFDPIDSKFSVHTIHVIRDGEIIDRLDPSSFTIARQESDMANGVTDGDLTLYIEIPDIRIGDIIDYEISWTTRSALWPGEFSSDFSFQWSVPVEFFRKRILTPTNKPLTIKSSDPEFQPTISTTGAYTEYNWTLTNPDPKRSQSTVPQTFSNYGHVSVSTFAEWEAVATSLTAEYNEGIDLPDGFAAREAWLTDDSTLNEKITSAIRFVQDKIRYVADETGVGSHIPRKPQYVIDRGWGDCKDKSLLLVSILRSLGVESYVVLTDIDEGFALPQKAPTPFVFDHAIVTYIVDGKRYWNDPTSFQQGGIFPEIAQPVYGFGLPIKERENNLWEIQASGPQRPNKTIQETFDFSGFYEDGLTLHVESEYIGRQADRFRREIEASSQSTLSQNYLDYYQKRYPGMVAEADLEITDDRDANKIITLEKYNFAREHYAEKPIETAIPLRADAVLSVLDSINFSDRTAPISLPYPAYSQHIFLLKNVGADSPLLSKFEMSTDYFEYSRTDKSIGQDTTTTYLLKTLASEAPLSEAENYASLTTELDDYGYLEFNYQPDDTYDTETILILIGIIVGLITLIYLPFGIMASFKRDEQLAGQSVFYPISLTKFIVLNIATIGSYSLFWMWRCWRWVRANGADEIKPIWRAFFSVIWFFPLFSEIRGHREDSKIPVALGVLLAVGYVLIAIMGNVAELAYEDSPLISTVLTFISGLFFLMVLPLVMWTNKLNENTPEILQQNSRMHPSSFALLVLGVLLWALIIYGSFPEGT